jgi:putative N6-adenine-specific DNA methylase
LTWLRLGVWLAAVFYRPTRLLFGHFAQHFGARFGGQGVEQIAHRAVEAVGGAGDRLHVVRMRREIVFEVLNAVFHGATFECGEATSRRIQIILPGMSIDHKTKCDLIATAAFGLEAAVAYELKQLGYTDQHVEPGRVTFRADVTAITRTNMFLRVADRVLLRVGEFPARTFDELFDGVRALPWGDWLSEDALFPVDGKSVKSMLSSVPAVQGVVKKAIADAMAERYGRAISPETGGRVKVLVALLEDVATLTIDTSGEGLHKRGYRPLNAVAPLKETLAAGLLSIARWFPDRPFADPLCGSGTLPLEAAMMALNIAPGKLRRFDAEGWPVIAAQLWRDARTEAIDGERRSRPIEIYGSDIDEEVLGLARRHADILGLGRRLKFEKIAVKDWKALADYGFIVTNPPYGERLGEAHEVEQLYAEMGEAFAKAPTWSVHVITGYERFERFYGKVATKKRKLYNGRIRCDLYAYPGPRRPRPVDAAYNPADVTPRPN